MTQLDACGSSDNYRRGAVAIRCASTSPSATAAITTIDGLPCLSAQFTLQPGTTYTLSTVSLPYGRYIATISTLTAASRHYFSR